MNVKHNLLTSVLLSTLVGVGVGAGAATGADNTWLLKQGFFGSQVQSRPDATIKIGNTTEDIHVDHFATVKFENNKGRSFVWRFDSTLEMSNFPLKTIAPSGFDAGNARVIVWHPSEHLGN